MVPKLNRKEIKLICALEWRWVAVSSELRCFASGIILRRFFVRTSSGGGLGWKEPTTETRVEAASVSESESSTQDDNWSDFETEELRALMGSASMRVVRRLRYAIKPSAGSIE
jgi:hypothetical protein